MAFPQKNTRQPKTKRMNAYSLREKAHVYNFIKNKLPSLLPLKSDRESPLPLLLKSDREIPLPLLLKSDRESPLYDLLSRK